MSNITIEEILEITNRYHHRNLIIETNKTLDCKGNIIYINNDIAVVIGKLLNNLYMVQQINKILKEYTDIKYVIWNKAETLTEQAQNALRTLLLKNESIGFIFITNDFNKISRPIQARCILVGR